MSGNLDQDILTVDDLHKTYGKVEAVRGLSFAVKEKEIFGIVGPNGAGKTTTLEICEGLRPPDKRSGPVSVVGIDVVSRPEAVKELIGVQLQATALFDKLTVYETLKLFGSFYERSLSPEMLLDMVNLESKTEARTDELSGGQQQRLAIALALVNDPELVFLDEPTTGLDPAARRKVWEVVEGLRQRGKTVILTTHYMEEAEVLCDRVAIVDHGKLIALDTPRQLISGLDHSHALTFKLDPAPEGVKELLEGLPGAIDLHRERGGFELHSQDLKATLPAFLKVVEEAALQELGVQEATLEDVFLELTGRRVRD